MEEDKSCYNDYCYECKKYGDDVSYDGNSKCENCPFLEREEK